MDNDDQMQRLEAHVVRVGCPEGGTLNFPRSAGAVGSGLPWGQVVRNQEGTNSSLRTRGDLRGVSGEEK